MKKVLAILFLAVICTASAANSFAAEGKDFSPVKPTDTALYQFLVTTMGGFSGMGGARMLQIDARGIPLVGSPDEAWLLPPKAMQMNDLPLVRPVGGQSNATETYEGSREDWTMKIYWGSSKTVQPGQPIVISTKDAGKNSTKLFNYQPSVLSHVAPKNGWGWGVWPNTRSSEAVPSGASLKGEHFLRGNYLPHIRFNVERHDFLDAIKASSSGGGSEYASVNWGEVPGAAGYFVYAMAANEAKREMTIWTSSAKATTGIQGHEYSSKIRDLAKQGIILTPDKRDVDIPAGIFADSENTILMIHGWGEDFYASYPPKPENAPKNWKPDWTARGLFLSSWTGILGMEVPNVTGNYQDSDESRRASEGGESIDDSSRTTEAWIHVPFVGSVKVKDTQKKTEKNETKEPEAQKSAADSKAEQPRAETTEPALSPEPAPEEPEDVTQPEPSFDPNTTTDAKVINSYPLTSKEKNTLGIQQRGAYNLYAKKKYKDALAVFSKLTDDYPEINYLSAYWAGMTSLKIKNGRAEALEWFNRALEINPDYKPAATEKMKLEKRK